MKGLKYQLKSVLRDKFCLMTFLLPILVAVALNFMGSIEMSSPGELHFGVLENGASLKTAISGDGLDIFQQAAAALPAHYEQWETAAQVQIQTLERPDIPESLQGIFIPAVLIVAMFMGCTFNAMNIISEKEDGVAFVNEILPMSPGQYILQKVVVGFLFGSISSMITACICFRLSWQNFGIMFALIVLSSFVAALIGLFIGKLSEGLMVGVVYIKIIMLVFIAVPILCALIGVSGLSAVLCNLVPSQPAFDGIMALSAGNTGAAIKDAGILSIHCVVWPALYVLLFTQRKKQGGYSI